ncbi:MAG: signal peptidase I [Candidatus Pacebacteria bacterium]|nr:signal peptidase I [Candidatus Paceibacterota bacterium]
MRKFLAGVLEVFEIAVIAVGAVFIIRIFLVQPFLVSGTSMYPNFADGNYVLTDELTYRIRPPERGEVVVFHDPQDYSTYFIKRVIGLPGERVTIFDNKVTVYNTQHPDGMILDESYLPAGTQTAANGCSGGVASGSSCTYTISSSTYLALGDNRQLSFDSRSWGPLPAANIVGLVRFRLWPLNQMQIFNAPGYGS